MSTHISITTAGWIRTDPEFKYIGDKAVLSFSMPYEPYSKKGEEKPTIWPRFTLWGPFAESMEPYLKKGVAVALTGQITGISTWLTKGGEPRASLEIRVDQLTMITWPDRPGDGAPQPAAEQPASDEIPF